MGAGLRPIAKVVDKPPDHNARAPVLESTVIHSLSVLVRLRNRFLRQSEKNAPY